MTKLNKKTIISIVLGGLALFYFFIYSGDEKENNIVIKVKQGELAININCTGELLSEKSINIMGPRNLAQFRIYNIKITDILQEGTVVKKGDYIAQLEKSTIMNNMKDYQENIERLGLEIRSAKLDTTLELKSARNDILNKKFALEEEKIKLTESIYESPATIRQIEINYDKIQRSFKQQKENYELRKIKTKAKVSKLELHLAKANRKLQTIKTLISDLTIKAPSNGMLIYAKRGNSKTTKDSQISAWYPLVATLPDLSKLISKTYVNEIEISKVKVGQIVEVGIDAFPKKRYKGKVIRVANIGEKISGEVAKVFEVTVKLEEGDSVLKPSMTTSNKISINKYTDVLTIPLEALHSFNDVNFVYLKSGMSIKKQVVKTGETNNQEIIITEGLKKGESLLLNVPENSDELELNI